MISERDVENFDESSSQSRGGSILKIQSNPLHSEARVNAIKKTKRKRLILGLQVHTFPNGLWKLGGIVYHHPSPFGSQTEAIYFKGPPGSGKSWAAYSLAGQSFFAENRTWVLIDTKLSVTKNTKVYVKINGKEQNIKIGNLIDEILPSNKITQEKNIEYLNYQVMSLDSNHNVSWKPIHAVSKHKSPQKIIKITTRSGRTIESTEGHSFVTLNKGKYGSMKGSDLKKGDYIPIANNNPIEKRKIDRENAFLIDLQLENINTIQISKIGQLSITQKTNIQHLINSNVWWDKIESIEYLDPTSEFVYDICVKETENFMLSNSCIVHNSYLGNNRPNYTFMDNIRNVNGFPNGIAHTQIDVIAPMYYVAGLTPEEINDSWVTDYYRVPLRLCTLPVMFELTKLNKKAGYASSFDQKFKDLMIRTNNNPQISDIHEMINEIIADDRMSRMKWVYQMMQTKIEEVADNTICEDRWSPVGKCLERAAEEGRARWIVFTLGHAQNPEDDLNLAIVSTVLKEIHMFSEIVRHNPTRYPNFQIGVMMDELHTYVRNKDASTRGAIHDLLFAWGRTSKVLRMFLTQKDDQLDKVFRDNIEKSVSPVGTYQCVISCSAIPEPGYVTYVNRVQPNPAKPDQPLYYPKVKSVPPLFEVESDEPDNEKWKDKLLSQWRENIQKQKEQSEAYLM